VKKWCINNVENFECFNDEWVLSASAPHGYTSFAQIVCCLKGGMNEQGNPLAFRMQLGFEAHVLGPKECIVVPHNVDGSSVVSEIVNDPTPSVGLRLFPQSFRTCSPSTT
jgi:hypothetical protein